MLQFFPFVRRREGSGLWIAHPFHLDLYVARLTDACNTPVPSWDQPVMKRLSHVFNIWISCCLSFQVDLFVARPRKIVKLMLYYAHHARLFISRPYIKAELRCVLCATARPTPPRLSTQLNNQLITAPTASKARRIASRRTLDQDATPGTSQPLG